MSQEFEENLGSLTTLEAMISGVFKPLESEQFLLVTSTTTTFSQSSVDYVDFKLSSSILYC